MQHKYAFKIALVCHVNKNETKHTGCMVMISMFAGVTNFGSLNDGVAKPCSFYKQQFCHLNTL